jgi:hypothetical protein
MLCESHAVSSLGDPNESDALAAEVRASVARTHEERTAVLRYAASETFWWGLRRPAQPPPLGGLKLLSRRTAGSIEFLRDRAMYWRGGYWELFIDGDGYIGKPGEWEPTGRNTELTPSEPHWLLALIESCTQAWERGSLTSKGQTYRWLELRCDLTRAVSPAGRKLRPGLLSKDIDPAKVKAEVALDNSQRVYQASFINRGWSVTKIQLSGFGEPGPIEAPASSEVVAEE